MIRAILGAIVNFLGRAAAIAAFFFLSKADGKKEEKIKNLEQEKKNNAEAKSIQDKVSMDSEYRNNIRRLFSDNPNNKP